MVIKELENIIKSKTSEALAVINEMALIPETLSCRIHRVVDGKSYDPEDDDEVAEGDKYLIFVSYQIHRKLGLEDDYDYELNYRPCIFDLIDRTYMTLYPTIMLKVAKSLLRGEDI